MQELLSNIQPLHCPSGCRSRYVKRGYFYRKDDHKRVQRFLCPQCLKSFSAATADPEYKQHKRLQNLLLLKLFSGGYSQRRAAFATGMNRKTIIRKFLWLGRWSRALLESDNRHLPQVACMEFDDLETHEQSKCKPLSITLAVEHGTRRILGFAVSQMPAKGRLARIGVRKYGRRSDDRPQGRRALFGRLQPFVSATAIIRSDQNPHYSKDVKEFFPQARHEVFKGVRGCITGQGELKKIAFDPLFSLNHTCAMLRANINRLFRSTWNTTKKRERLADHIALYALVHNRVLIHHKAR